MSTEKNIVEIIELMRRDNSVDAPDDQIRWASNLFRTRASEPNRSLMTRLVAALQMEIAPNKPAFGERSASTSQGRQLLFQAGDHAVDLRIEPRGKTFGIRGQILGEGFGGASIRLVNDTTSFETTASEISEFTFASVPAGEYELTADGDKFEIVLKAINIE